MCYISINISSITCFLNSGTQDFSELKGRFIVFQLCLRTTAGVHPVSRSLLKTLTVEVMWDKSKLLGMCKKFIEIVSNAIKRFQQF